LHQTSTLETWGELQLVDATRLLLQERDVYVHVIERLRYDAGDKNGSIKAAIDFALQRAHLHGKYNIIWKRKSPNHQQMLKER
jgi:UTP-glucose-1-phosphate uridylyltransferase